jgi:hypothetical protein
MRGANQVVEIQRHACAVLDVLLSERIHVMYDQSRMDLIPFDAEITTSVSQYGLTSYLPPSFGGIESLIDPSIESESLATDLSPNRKVFEPFFKRFELDQLFIRPIPGTHRTQAPGLREDYHCKLALREEHPRSDPQLASQTPMLHALFEEVRLHSSNVAVPVFPETNQASNSA